jgi:tetratricopeptide (TPR) repeat protein
LRESSAAGSYQVRVVDWRAALPEDEKRVAAILADNEGDRLRALGKAESRRQAVARYEAALKLWQAAHDARGEALTDAKLGSVFYALGNFGKALEHYLQGLDLTRSVGDRALEAKALQSAGGAYSRVGQPDEALAMLEPALEIQRDLRDRRAQAITLNSLAFTYYSTGQPQPEDEQGGCPSEIGSAAGVVSSSLADCVP